MIETKNFRLTQKEYTKIILSKRLKKSWWLYLLIFVLGILHLKNFGEDSFSTFFTIFAFCYPFLVLTYLYFWANSKEHKPIFSETKLSFDNDFIYLERNGNESKINLDSIQKSIPNNHFWMLYISKEQFIYIPKNIFNTKEDYTEFSNLIISKK